jgi:hypothetical protein
MLILQSMCRLWLQFLLCTTCKFNQLDCNGIWTGPLGEYVKYNLVFGVTKLYFVILVGLITK